MAEIFAFRADDRTATGPNGGNPHLVRPPGVPDVVWHAVETVRAMRRVPDVRYREVAVPCSWGDYGIGVEMTCERDAETRGRAERNRICRGWIRLMYSHDLRPEWRSHWRCVAYAEMPIDQGEHNALAPALYWGELHRFVADHICGDLTGTVTIRRDTSFGASASDCDGQFACDGDVGCEMRVSWTPPDDEEHEMNAGEQVRLWSRFIRSMTVP